MKKVVNTWRTQAMNTYAPAASHQKMIRQFFDYLNTGNTPKMKSLFSEQAQWICPGMPQDIRIAGTFTGPQGFTQFYKKLQDLVLVTSFSATHTLGNHERIVTIGHFSGLVRFTEEAFDSSLVIHFELYEGLIEAAEMLFDTAAVSLAFSGSE